MGNNKLYTVEKKYSGIKYSLGLAILFLMTGLNIFSQEMMTMEEIAKSKETLKSSVGTLQNKVEAEKWFLNPKNDIRSSYFLEETATEFDIQGLELDWTIVCWDANLRYNQNFEYYNFTGDSWKNINKEEIRVYLNPLMHLV